MKRVLWMGWLCFCWGASGCGGGGEGLLFDDSVPTQSLPLMTRVEPAQGAVGSTVALFGSGFSSAAPNNLIMLGGILTPAESYAPAAAASGGETEMLTVTVPPEAGTGESAVFVTVFETTSNTDLSFTVTP